MRWLVALLAAKAEHTGGLPAVVLDPFLGSGSTGVACVAERVRFVGIERDQASFDVARSRILAAIGSPEHAAEANEVAPAGAQLSLL
jgi:DNA modification methylase